MAFRLAALITVACLAGVDPVDQGSGGNWAVYRSSVLGFSVEYPKSWSKQPPRGLCYGDVRMPESISDVLARPVYPVVFSRSSEGKSVHIKVIREFDKTLSDEVERHRSAWLYTEERPAPPEVVVTDFTSADGFVGKRLTRSGTQVHAAYLLVAAGRLIALTTNCSPGDWPDLQKITDQMAASLRLFPREDDAPRPGAYKTCSGPGFTLEYPGDWWLAKAFDDEGLFRFGQLQVFGAYLGFNTSVVVTLRTEQTDQGPQSFVRSQLKVLAASGLKVRSRVTPFVTDAGRKGSKLRSDYRGAHSVQYVLPAGDDGLWVLTCSLDREHPEQTEQQADRIARCLRFD